MNVIVKLPNSVNEKVLTFPFLTRLEELLKEIAHNDPEDDTYQIHLISTKGGIEVLNLLSFTAFYHELDEEDLKTVFTIHRGCKEFTITNKMDCFISTTRGFVDSSIGKNLGIKKSIGFDQGKNKWVLSDVVSIPEGLHVSDTPTKLLTALDNQKYELPNISPRTLEPTYIDWSENPYYMIDLNLVAEEKIDESWTELFEHMTNQKFVFICSELKPHLQEDIVLDFISQLPSKNTYKFSKHDSLIDFAKTVSFSLGLCTQNLDLMTIASFCGTTTHFVNPGLDLKTLTPKYFRGELKDISFDAEAMNTVFDEIISFVSSKMLDKDNKPDPAAPPADKGKEPE